MNTLRLWTARAVDPIRLDAFNSGDYAGALGESNKAEIITRVLYPSDSTPAGQELRLRQEYFFTSASLQDIIRRHVQQYDEVRSLADKVAIQLNDTHPAMAVAELMRILIDNHGLGWDEAWEITKGCIGYTNHTLLPEALESWPVHLFERMSAAPHADRLRHQCEADCGGAGQARLHAGFPFLHLAHRRTSWPSRAHGSAGLCRIAQHQRRVGPSHGADEGNACSATCNKLYPGPHQQQDQRHHAAALAAGRQSGTGRAPERSSIGEGVLDDAMLLAKAKPFAKDPAFRERFAAIKRPTRRNSPISSRPAWASASIPQPCSTCRSSASMNTSASS